MLKVFDEWCNIICIFDLHYTVGHEKLPDQQDNLIAPNNWMGQLLSPETKRSISSALSYLFYCFLYRESSSESILIIQDLSQVPTLNLVSLSKLVDCILWNYAPRFFLCFSTKGTRAHISSGRQHSWLLTHNCSLSWTSLNDFKIRQLMFLSYKKKQCTLSLSHKEHNKCLKYIKIFIPSGRQFDWSLWDLKNIQKNYIFCQPK